MTQDKETLREAAARAYWSVALKNGLANDLRDWDAREWEDGDFNCFSPALDSNTKALVLEAMDAAIATVFEHLRSPSQEMIEAYFYAYGGSRYWSASYARTGGS